MNIGLRLAPVCPHTVLVSDWCNLDTIDSLVTPRSVCTDARLLLAEDPLSCHGVGIIQRICVFIIIFIN